MNEFAKKMRAALAERLGEGYRVEIRDVTKINGVVLTGLFIISDHNNIIPTIYLERFYRVYETGMPFEEVVDNILKLYMEQTPNKTISMEYFKFYEQVKDRICYKLINKNGNERLLEDIPYLDYFDLAICFYYAFYDDKLGEGSILIHNSHLELWSMGIKDLMKNAMENTPVLYPQTCVCITQLIEDMLPKEKEMDLPEDVPMKVLSNEKKTFGASCILYPGLLRKLSEEWGQNMYIIPSSVHEGATRFAV